MLISSYSMQYNFIKNPYHDWHKTEKRTYTSENSSLWLSLNNSSEIWMASYLKENQDAYAKIESVKYIHKLHISLRCCRKQCIPFLFQFMKCNIPGKSPFLFVLKEGYQKLDDLCRINSSWDIHIYHKLSLSLRFEKGALEARWSL